MNEENTQNNQYSRFVFLLQQQYGKFDPTTKKFEKTSNSKIARDLFYSDSQFSRLINGTASKGEFDRAINNISRLLEIAELRQKTQQTSQVNKFEFKKIRNILLFVIIVVGLGVITYKLINSTTTKIQNTTNNISRYNMLEWSFNSDYVNPYTNLRELPADCYFPCYKYQGKWILKNEYKIPFFSERNGFHYVAKEAILYVKCSDNTLNNKGENFEGYEYQKHELWYDQREFPIDSFLIKGSEKDVRDNYNSSNFVQDPNFVKIAEVHTFFRNQFKIDSSYVYRKGKVIGRDIEFEDLNLLKENLGNIETAKDIRNEFSKVIKNRLEDFSEPIDCNASPVSNKDFNYITAGDEMSFSCEFTTGRFKVHYKKTYVLEDQYIRNSCR